MEPGDKPLALTMLAGTIGFADEPKVEAIVDVQAAQECLEGRHIMRVEASDRAARRRAEFAGEFVLKHVCFAEMMAGDCGVHFVWHGAEVFAHEHGFVAMRFQAEDGVKFFRRVLHIGAFARGAAFRDPVKPMQPHDVIDAKQSGVAHLEAQHFDQKRAREARVALTLRIVGGLTVKDTGIDLAVAAAVLGLELDLGVDPDAVVIGEVGLRGEVKPAPRMETRLKEAKAMGFRMAFVSAGTAPLDGIGITEVVRVREVFGPDHRRPGL